jgi:thiosulfate/3-mercaptopyruvate sulfurtransferase
MTYLKISLMKKINNGKAIAITSSLASILVLCLALTLPALAGTETGEFCPTCPDWTDLDGWLAKKAAYEQEQQQKYQLQSQEKEVALKAQNIDPAPVETASDPTSGNSTPVRSGSFAEALASPSGVTVEDIVLDISPSATEYIEGSVNLNYEDFMDSGGSLKPIPELAKLLGDAGISANDSLVIAGECLPCGGGPSPAVFTYWLLKYLGHEKVRVLDGGIEDWKDAGLNVSNAPAIRPQTNYTPTLKPDLLASYDFVQNGGAQIVDARPASNFVIGSIPGAINIPYEGVVENERIRPEEDLKRVFLGLDKDRPVVVYTNVGVEASLVWFALTLSGYDARLYTWKDWLENQPKFKFELVDVQAKPNPVRSGSTTTITASFQEKQMATAGNSSSGGEAKLTIKGCATCGFEGFALGTSGASGASGNKSGTIQLSSSGKTSQSSTADQDSALHCTAIIKASDGSEAASTSLLRTSGYKFVGIWNANVAPGVYKVSIAASVSGSTETFADVLEIEVAGKA